ncbi:MAG: UDP-glucose/GDP-mannose dehydrogenase family protein [Prevotella sp.]|nr:UDP-glucose/GDP-mannose dehydrogenase family protein [Prevotella sp.]MBQ4294623.1 UDP-glucose/GDP-mannose dehydrogenase family protein [Prevotella sp.]
MVITVFGLGFVGLTTSLGFAEYGHKVYGVEINPQRLETIKGGKLPFLEPGLDEALIRHLNKNFNPIGTDQLEEAVRQSDCIYYCVGTPYGKDGQADLTYLLAAIDQTIAARDKDKYMVLVVKSTIPPSTTSTKIIPHLKEKGLEVGVDVGVANNPEFLREGHCWDDFINADRIVLGVSDERSAKMLKEVYATVKEPVFCVSLNTGEFIKYLSNTLLATLISYSNEMSIVADTIGDIDVAQAFRILHMDKRWGGATMASYVYPGCGYGGYCLPKDTNALYAVTRTAGFDAKILHHVIDTNDHMPQFIATKIIRAIGSDKSRCIGILGLSFKPGSDDVRDTPSAKIIKALLEEGYTNICGYDPVAIEEFSSHYRLPIGYVVSYEEMLKKADALVITTAWPEFKDVRERTSKTVVDCRYML